MFLKHHTPLDYQIEGIKAAQGKQGFIIGDEMGLGKTIQAIGIINTLRAFPKVLVICPSVSKYSWLEEIENWQTYPYSVQVIDAKDEWHPDNAEVTVINYDIIKRFQYKMWKTTWDLVIADEFHYLRDVNSQRSITAYGLKSKARLYLSGTPVPNKIKNLWAPLRSLSTSWGARHEFTKKYCGGHWRKGFRGRKEWWCEGATNLDELHRRMDKFMVRRFAKDVLDLPPLTSEVIRVSSYDDELAQAIEDLAAELAGSGKDINPTDPRKKTLAEYRKQAGDIKLPHAIKIIKEVIKKEKIVVFAYHREVTKALYRAFEDQAVMVIGGTPSKRKKANAEKFNKDKNCKVFIGNLESAGVTLTLTAASKMLFVEHDWQPVSVMQASKRCHRIGQEKPVHVQYLVLDDGIDVKMTQAIDAKVRHMKEALDGVEPSWADLIFNT